jgi:hypothetical protein
LFSVDRLVVLEDVRVLKGACLLLDGSVAKKLYPNMHNACPTIIVGGRQAQNYVGLIAVA